MTCDVYDKDKSNQQRPSSENHDIRSSELNHGIISEYKDNSLTTTSYIMQKHHITFKCDHIVYPLWNVSEWTYDKTSQTIWWLVYIWSILTPHLMSVASVAHIYHNTRSRASRALIGLMMSSLNALIRDLCLKMTSMAFWDLFGAVAFSLKWFYFRQNNFTVRGVYNMTTYSRIIKITGLGSIVD